MKMRTRMLAGVAALMWSWPAMAGSAPASTAPPAVSESPKSTVSNPDSKRMERAKDYIADEQWARAIVELQAVANDPKEANRDEALFWLAQSEHETGDHPAAIQTIARLERQYPKSRWVRLARSLRVEIAQRLNRDDVLWAVVAPPPPPPAPRARTPRPPTPPAAAVPPAAHAFPFPSPPPPRPSVPAMPAHPLAVAPATAPSPMPPAPVALMPGAEYFLPMPYPPDIDLKIEALNGLLEAHSERVIPLLREIALDGNNPDEARRAILVLARSPRPEARTTVADVARRGAEPVRLAAIRAMGRFEDAGVSAELMEVYSSATTPRVKRQIVSSLGERADNTSLLRIAKDESDPVVRDTAIVTLGRLPGARTQLRTLYGRTPPASRMAVLSALFASKDEDELIRIARMEQEPLLRQRARMQLRMLATPKALKFLDDNP